MKKKSAEFREVITRFGRPDDMSCKGKCTWHVFRTSNIFTPQDDLDKLGFIESRVGL